MPGRSACQILGLHRATFYRLRKPPTSIRTLRRTIVADEIAKLHHRSRGTYGRRRIRAALMSEFDMVVNHKLVNSIMGELSLSGLPRRKGRKPDLLNVDTPSDLVNRLLVADQPNELWCSGITEHPAPWIPAVDATPVRVVVVAGAKYSKEQFFDLLDRGGTGRAAAVAAGVASATAYGWVRRSGLAMRRSAPRTYTEDEKAEFFRLLAR
ncbi:IS3 family transposase [Nocardia vinacea]|uniref:IS3 family transposase n=1 Tax=Nocardia vinacea TaxID=96468 RepID=UPI0033E22332